MIKKIKFIGLLFPLFLSCKSSLYSNICDCNIKFQEKDITPIVNDEQNGFHGDGYIINAYRYNFLDSQDILKLKAKGFVNRSNIYIPAISELNSIINYDSTQLCFVKKSDNEKVFQACIIDTSKRIIVAYQISQ